ncbi:MAG: hypothetical protein WCU88_02275 [Elusimicrobiota bacterium]|jgi:hypothetical protein
MIVLRLADPSAGIQKAAAGLARPLRVLVLDAEPGLDAGLQTLLSEAGVRLLDLPALADERGPSFAHDYTDFIAGLSRANACPDWWAFTLIGRNPLSSRLPERCFRLDLALSLAKEEPAGSLLIFLRDRALARAIAQAARERGLKTEGLGGRETRPWREVLNAALPSGPIFGYLRALWQLLRVRAVIRWKPEPGRAYVVVATLLNHQSFDSQGSYHDAYFGPLPGKLHSLAANDNSRSRDSVARDKNQTDESSREPLVFGSVTHDFERTLARCNRACTEFPVLPMESFLRGRDLWPVLLKALRYRLVGFALKGDSHFRTHDALPLIQEELARNFQESRLFSDLWFKACADALLQNIRAERLLFPFENRAWERMLMASFRENAPQAPLIGYQHATITPFHLNFMLGEQGQELLPLPNRIVTMGEVTLERMAEQGFFPRERLALGCALRQSPAKIRETRAPGSRLRVLSALASSQEEYRTTLRLLKDAFPGQTHQLVLRPHPVIPLAPALKAAPLPFEYEIDSGSPLNEALGAADVVLFASSTLGLEAVRRGIPAVFLRVGRFLNTDPMSGFTELKWSARTPRELRSVLEEIAALEGPALQSRRQAGLRYAQRYCRLPESDDFSAF